MMLGVGGEAACRGYAERTNLPAYTRNTITTVERLVRETRLAVERGYALDDEEAEIGVGCIGVLVYDSTGNAAAGLSVSAPIERRRSEWVAEAIQAAKTISEKIGWRAE
jgi:DNA-binding IclR family transcriptional regulator